MAHSRVVEIVSERVRAIVAPSAVIVEGEVFDPPADASSYLELAFPYARAKRVTFGAPGANVYREEGAFSLTLSLPRGEALQPARRLLETIADALRGSRVGAVEFLAPQPPILDDDKADQSYLRLLLAVPYIHDLEG